MICPKCKAVMIHECGGYVRAKRSEGSVAPTGGFWSCWRCGNHIEEPDAPVLKMSRDFIKDDNYENTGKYHPSEDPWIKELVIKNINTIEAMRSKAKSWPEIVKAVSDKRIPSRQQLCNTYHRIKRMERERRA